MAFTSSNPVLGRVLDRSESLAGRAMTLRGVLAKAALLLALALAAAAWSFVSAPALGGRGLLPAVAIGASLVAIGGNLWISFRPHLAASLGPAIVLAQGVLIGLIVAFTQRQYAGLPLQALVLTGGVTAGMFAGYATGALRLGERGKAIVVGLTTGVFFFYIVAFVASLAGFPIPFVHEGGALGIGFSLFVTALAAFNLLLDFERIDVGIRERVDASAEWGVAVGLVLTLLWLYVELLRLLRKLRD